MFFKLQYLVFFVKRVLLKPNATKKLKTETEIYKKSFL